MTALRLLACILAATCPGVEILPMWWSDPPAPAPEVAVDEGGAQPRTIRLLRLCPLETLKGRPGEPWTLLRKVPATEPGKPPSWVNYAGVVLPTGAERLAVLVIPTEPAQALAVEISQRSHAWGSTRLINLTGKPIEGWVGRRQLRLEAGGQASSEAAVERRTEELVLFTAGEDGVRKLILSSRVILDPGRRSLVFLARLTDGTLETRAMEEGRPENPAGATGAR